MDYRSHIIGQYHRDMAVHHAEMDKALCAYCEKGTEIPGRLCGKCEQYLERLCTSIDTELEWLGKVADAAACGIYHSECGSGARPHETSNLPVARIAADELNKLAEGYARKVMAACKKPPTWRGQPGSYLRTCLMVISRQDWAPEFMDTIAKALGRVKRAFPKPNDKLKPNLIENLQCPKCGNESLQFHPSNHVRQPEAIYCHHTNEDDGQTCAWFIVGDDEAREHLNRAIAARALVEQNSGK
jgi:hypothetical protein